MPAYQKLFEENTQKALNTIRYRLQTLLETKPLSNKIHSKVVIFRYEKTSKFDSTNLKDVSLTKFYQVFFFYIFRFLEFKLRENTVIRYVQFILFYS